MSNGTPVAGDKEAQHLLMQQSLSVVNVPILPLTNACSQAATDDDGNDDCGVHFCSRRVN